ncbi:MAG TPA: DUF6805 domain-containing protein [Candidatus Polarisedimenticolia bacterium]|nr:DUF6805 domain-containing protein [Candidatus Polarisedimenticolia bacterium]
MSDFKFFCPDCGQKIAYDDSYSGRQVTCPTCQKSFVAPTIRAAPGQPAVPAATPTSADPGSTVNVPRALALGYPYLALAGLLAAVLFAVGSIPIIILVWAILAFLPIFCSSIGDKRSRRLAAVGLKASCFGIGLLILFIGARVLAKQYYAPKIVIRESPAELDALKPRIVDEVLTALPSSEREHHLGGKYLLYGPFNGKFWRSAVSGGSISYVMKVLPDQAVSLNCRYWGGEQAGRTFDISVDDKVIATQNLEFNVPGHFFDSEYRIPRGLTRGKTQVTIKFQAHPGLAAGGLFGCQILKR